MDQKHLLTQALGFLQAQRRHRWWLRTVTGMAAMVVFVTTYLLILPAITMENSIFDVTAEPPEASLGERIHSEVYAVADDGREETFFVLTADGDNAGLDERRLDFDHNDVAVIQDEDGQSIELHREYTESGEVNYASGPTENENTVKLEFSNNPYWNGEGTPDKGETPEDTVWVFT